MLRINLLSLLIISTATFSQVENTWVKKATFAGQKREKAIAFALGEFGYVGCGVDSKEMTHNDLWKYDPSLDSWTQVASLPGSTRKNAIAFTVENYGYVGTGFDSNETDAGKKLADLWRYDPLTNSWSERAPYPGGDSSGVYIASAFAIGKSGYVVGGKVGANSYLHQLWEYNTELDEWIQRTPFPGGDRYQMVAFAIEGKGYAGLGTDHDVFRKDFWQYDPIINVWYAKPPFSGSERGLSSTFTIGSKGFVVFGTDGGDKDELWEYNHHKESWNIKAPFPGGSRKNGIAFAIGDIGYVGMGKSSSEGKKRSFYAYYPSLPLEIHENSIATLNIFPNPFHESARITIPLEMVHGTLTLFSISGQPVLVRQIIESETFINRENLPNGVYYLEYKNNISELKMIKKIILL